MGPLLLLLVSLLQPARAAESQALPSRDANAYTLGVRGTYFVPADAERGTWGPGVQARYFLNPRWAVEVAGDYMRQEFKDTTAHTAAAQLSLVALFGPDRMKGLLLAGGGFYATRVNGPSYRRNIAGFGPHAGVGVELRLTPVWSVDTTYRRVWLADLESRDASTGAPRSFARSGDQISLGLNRLFR